MKALKRQVDEAEEEIERLDSLRKKAQRELEEQHEVNEQLQTRIKSLEKDAWYDDMPALLYPFWGVGNGSSQAGEICSLLSSLEASNG